MRLIQFLLYIFISSRLLISSEANHILIKRIVTQPDIAESISIYNPTDYQINLSNYYICDDEKYYTIQTNGDLIPSSIANGFIGQFPNININAKETFTIVLNQNYSQFYSENFIPDLLMYPDYDNSMLETETGSFGGASNKINENSEMVILFYWDGNSSSTVKDVDYFIWGNNQNSIDKSVVEGYNIDTPPENQLYFENIAEQYYAYSRVDYTEIDENKEGGNGINGHDEMSENFRESWEIIELFTLGCTDSNAPNYNPLAEIDNGSCLIPFKDVLDGFYDCNASSNGYCDTNPACPTVNLRGMIVDYFDVTVYGGPHAITIEDEEGYRVEATIWPSEWDIASDETSSFLITPPFYKYLIEFKGSVFEYDGDKQILICNPEDFTVIKSFDLEGYFVEENISSVQILPAPFIFLPTLGETLDFTYSFKNESRIIIRIYDLSGRFITSLTDKYYPLSGTVSRYEDTSAWDGRDQLGQIVSPGTYIIHIEAMNPQTGKTETDAAPIVVGVKN